MRLFLNFGSYLFLLFLFIDLTGQSSQKEVPLSETDAVYGFYEYLPEGYEKKMVEYPLIIFLHGRGERGDGEADLWKVKENGPHRLVEEGREFPSVILSPQSAGYWNIDSLDTFISWAFDHYSIDTERLYLTGISMGGAGVWLYAVSHPDKPRAIVPVSGDVKPTDPEKLVEMSVWAFHNEGDHVVEVELTYEWIEGIREAGGEPKLTVYNQSGHDAWTRTYNDESMWEWLFAQQPAPPPLNVDEAENEIVVYPNPFDNSLSFSFPGQLISARLYDPVGRLSTEWYLSDKSGTHHSVPVDPGILPGVYILELKSAKGTYRYRIIKK